MQKFLNFCSWLWVGFFGLLGLALIIDSTSSTFGGLVVLALSACIAPPVKDKMPYKILPFHFFEVIGWVFSVSRLERW